MALANPRLVFGVLAAQILSRERFSATALMDYSAEMEMNCTRAVRVEQFDWQVLVHVAHWNWKLKEKSVST
jgi:hypothetical protein